MLVRAGWTGPAAELLGPGRAGTGRRVKVRLRRAGAVAIKLSCAGKLYGHDLRAPSLLLYGAGLGRRCGPEWAAESETVTK